MHDLRQTPSLVKKFSRDMVMKLRGFRVERFLAVVVIVVLFTVLLYAVLRALKYTVLGLL